MDKYFSAMAARCPQLSSLVAQLTAVTADLAALFRRGNTLFTAGNGGSAADAEHICGELLKGFKSRRELSADDRLKFSRAAGEEGEKIAASLQYGLRTISLLSHPSFCTAFANDIDPELVFAQQLWALGRENDAVLAISTSGNAENIRQLFITARAKNIRTILLTGMKNGSCRDFADEIIAVPETETFRIQELHLPVYHAICLTLEAQFFQMME